MPFVEGEAYRRLCSDEIAFRVDGVARVTPTHTAPVIARGSSGGKKGRDDQSRRDRGRVVAASEFHGPGRVLDDNLATRWKADAQAKGASLILDLGKVRHVKGSELLSEYAWKLYPLTMDAPLDGKIWVAVSTPGPTSIQRSPTRLPPGDYRYLRASFAQNSREARRRFGDGGSLLRTNEGALSPAGNRAAATFASRG